MVKVVLDFFLGFLEGVTRAIVALVKVALTASLLSSATIYLVTQSKSPEVGEQHLPTAPTDTVEGPIFNEPIKITVDEKGQVLSAEFHILSERCRWVRESEFNIDCNGTQFLGRELIQSHLPPSLSDRIGLGADLVSIGAASVEGRLVREKQRSQQRAYNMATWVSQQLNVTGGIWIINMGRFKRPCQDCQNGDSSAQRPVILATIAHQEDPELVRGIIWDAMKASAAIPDPDNYAAFELQKLK